MTDEHNPEAVARYDAGAIMHSLDGIDPKPTTDPRFGNWVRFSDYEALAAKLAEAEAERDRVAAINVDHCRTINTYLVDNARLQDRAEAAEADLPRLRTAQDAMVGAVIQEAAKVVDVDADQSVADAALWRKYAMPKTAVVSEEQAKAGRRIAIAIRALRPDATSALERMLREARDAALEEAAKACDGLAGEGNSIDRFSGASAGICAHDIRKLKEQPE